MSYYFDPCDQTLRAPCIWELQQYALHVLFGLSDVRHKPGTSLHSSRPSATLLGRLTATKV